MTIITLCLLFLSSFIFSIPSHAQVQNIGASTIRVQQGKVSEVVFPSRVEKVVKGGDQESVLVEVLDNSVYLLPKAQQAADIFVTTSSGESYPLVLQESDERDIKIKIGNFQRRNQASEASNNEVMGLMKDLIMDKEPAGATLLPAKGEVLMSSKQMKLTVIKNYETINYKAMVLEARNLINNALIIPLEQISMPNLLAISADQDMLTAIGRDGDRAKVYLILGQSNEFDII